MVLVLEHFCYEVFYYHFHLIILHHILIIISLVLFLIYIMGRFHHLFNRLCCLRLSYQDFFFNFIYFWHFKGLSYPHLYNYHFLHILLSLFLLKLLASLLYLFSFFLFFFMNLMLFFLILLKIVSSNVTLRFHAHVIIDFQNWTYHHLTAHLLSLIFIFDN